MIPWIFFGTILPTGGVSTLSDIMFLAKKEFDGKLRSNEGQSSGTGDVATLTANTGKDMYLARAVISSQRTSGGNTATVELKVNGTTIETAEIGDGLDIAQFYEFKNVGHKVAAGQIIKIEVVAGSNTSTEGMVECWEEDTGVDPVI